MDVIFNELALVISNTKKIIVDVIDSLLKYAKTRTIYSSYKEYDYERTYFRRSKNLSWSGLY